MAAKRKTALADRARKCNCKLCGKDLTAVPTWITTKLRGHPVTREALRAPTRASVQITFSGADSDALPFITLWLCGECLALAAKPTTQQLILIIGGRLAAIGGKDDL